MAIENREWIMRGLDWDDPSRIQSWEKLIDWINEVGFPTLFKNEIPGFSAEENTSDLYWWTGDEEQDPWEWRELASMRCKRVMDQFEGEDELFSSELKRLAYLRLFHAGGPVGL